MSVTTLSPDAVRAVRKSVSRSMDAAAKTLARLHPDTKQARDLRAEWEALREADKLFTELLNETVMSGALS